MVKQFILWTIRQLATAILTKYKPLVIGVTGSVGKTSTKEAIATVLSPSTQVRRNMNSYNSESGVPLTIIGVESPGRNILGWLSVIAKGVLLLIRNDSQYPKILIQEMGADHPGNIDYLTRFTHPQIGVITAIAPVHVEYFGSIEAIEQEKGILIERLPTDGYAILNYDDERVRVMSARTKAQVLTYGLSEGADIRATDLRLDASNGQTGLAMTIHYKGDTQPVILPSSIGKPSALSALAATAVGISLGLDLPTIARHLATHQPPKGRMNVIAGIKNSSLLDDTYNASPAATIAALETLANTRTDHHDRMVAILGDMLELGSYSEQGHREVGHRAAEIHVDLLVTVGDEGRMIGLGAQERGFPQENIMHFDTSQEAADAIPAHIQENDLILIKGSQGTRMEHVSKALLAQPQEAANLLARQYTPWI